MINDLVSDALIRIKNGYLAYKPEIVLPYSKLITAILAVMENEGYISKFKEVSYDKNPNLKQIKATLKYISRKPALTDVKRISKPGLRIYKSNRELPRVLSGIGIAIISTPKGVMSEKQARKEGVGGEVLAYIW